MCMWHRPTPHGVGGLKYVFGVLHHQKQRPTPHGVGGLKSGCAVQQMYAFRSHPARGGWIEIRVYRSAYVRFTVPPRTGWVD